MQGYMNKIGWVDLTTRRVEIKELDFEAARGFIGGSALACRLVYDHVGPETDPLGPENPLVFMTGPLVGSGLPCTSRFAVCARSPLTNIWGEATSGGVFGPRLKRAGFDGLVITGRADSPVWLAADEGKLEIRDAAPLWGKDTYATQAAVKEELAGASVACIGPAGENQVLTAAVINDRGRAAGRCGLGAVMGSKNLKAVAAAGKAEVPLGDTATLGMMGKVLTQKMKEAAGLLTQYGTLGYLDVGYYFGDVPAYYFTETVFKAERVTGKRLREQFNVKFEACQGCPVACGRKTTLTAKYGNVAVDGPEYESAVALGPLCGVFDLEAAAYASHLCNLYGMDTISTGVTIAFAMYLLENGLVEQGKLGLDIRWGDAGGLIRLVEEIAHRQGAGELLGRGTERMARELGVDPGLAATVKGLEMPMHDPRAFAGMALSYATGPRGACHERGDFFQVDLGIVSSEPLGVKAGDRFNISGRAVQVAKLQNLRELDNALLRCAFTAAPIDVTSGLMGLLTGTPWLVPDLDMVGERSMAIKRLMNCRLGVTPADDALPEILRRPYRDGGSAGFVPDLAGPLAEYYTCRGWDPQTGRPTPAKLTELGLSDLDTGS